MIDGLLTSIPPLVFLSDCTLSIGGRLNTSCCLVLLSNLLLSLVSHLLCD